MKRFWVRARRNSRDCEFHYLEWLGWVAMVFMPKKKKRGGVTYEGFECVNEAPDEC